MTRAIPLLIGLCLIASPALAGSKQLTERQPIKREKALAVELSLGAGEVVVAPGSYDSLYDIAVDYNPQLVSPKVRYGGGVLALNALSLKKLNFNPLEKRQKWNLAFTQKLPIRLQADLGAAKSDLDLTGLRMKECNLSMGAGMATLRFSTPNPTVMERFRIEAGASNLDAKALGNANFQELDFEGGVGNFQLDFSGDYRRSGKVKVKVGMGRVLLVVPKSLGVKVSAARSMVNAVELPAELKGGRSPNYESAKGRLDFDIETGIGSVELRWD